MRKFVLLISAILTICSLESPRSAGAASTFEGEAPKYQIDGDFSDWKTYKTGWLETGLDWSNVRVTPSFEGIDLKEFYYDNDEAFLYLFFKCTPTIQQRYEKTRSTGMVGTLYIDSDMNTNTGCGTLDSEGVTSKNPRVHLGNSTVPGSDVQIYMPIGIYMNETTTVCYVSYEMRRFDPKTRSFCQVARVENSRAANHLIAHGKDGIEMAIRLSDLQMKKGHRFFFYCWEEGAPHETINKTIIQIE